MGEGGVSPSKALTLITNFNSSLYRDKPGLPRSTARLHNSEYEDDKPNYSVLGSGKNGLAGNTSSTRGKPSNSRGNTSTRDQQQPSLGTHLLEKGGARDTSLITIQNYLVIQHFNH